MKNSWFFIALSLISLQGNATQKSESLDIPQTLKLSGRAPIAANNIALPQVDDKRPIIYPAQWNLVFKPQNQPLLKPEQLKISTEIFKQLTPKERHHSIIHQAANNFNQQAFEQQFKPKNWQEVTQFGFNNVAYLMLNTQYKLSRDGFFNFRCIEQYDQNDYADIDQEGERNFAVISQ